MLFRQCLVLRQRFLSPWEARQILGLEMDLSTTTTANAASSLSSIAQRLRAAYFRAAKQCHPDLVKSGTSFDPAERFRLVTQAYELLQKMLQHQNSDSNNANNNNNNSIFDEFPMVDEEDEHRYRVACQEMLGQPAEIVEESKRCPMFRQWAMGKTDAAAYWRSFLMQHGGLAPRLNPKIMLTTSVNKIDRRRRKLR